MGEVCLRDEMAFPSETQKDQEGKRMSVMDILDTREAFSFEVFPPRTDVGMEALCGEGGVLDQLYALKPDYIACTYGAGGADVGKNLEVLDKIVRDGKTTGVTHFTCIGNTREGIKEQLQTYLDHGIDHMLALRGDLPTGWTGTWSGTAHYNQSVIRKMLLEYKRTGFMPTFDIQVSNEDPTASVGRQTIILKNCLTKGGILAKFDADAETLDEELEGTFDDWEMPETFSLLNGMQ